MKRSIYVTKPSLPPLDEYINEIRDIWDTGIMTHQGPKHNELCQRLMEYLKAPNLTLFANGHLALELGIEALGIKGEVITSPFTFGSTTQAILRNGCTPVFCDIRSDDFTIDATQIEALVTAKTKAIVPVHVYGNICDVDLIQDIADRHGLKVLYDAAHAFGEEYNGVNVANMGDASMFSFHATKVFNTVEGGCLVYKDERIKQFLEGLRQFGQIVKTDAVPYIGTNAKMTEIHAAMGLCNLVHLDEYIEKRKTIVDKYRKRLSEIDGIKLSVIQDGVKYNYAYFPVVFEEDKSGVDVHMVLKALADNGIFARRYFFPLCCDFECVKDMGFESDVPVARFVSDRVITLPCYSDLSLDDVDRICDIITCLYR